MSEARLGAFAAVAWKEAQHAWRDRSVLILVFLVPMLLAGITTLAFQRLASGDAATIGIVNDDNGPVSQFLMKEILPSLKIGGTQLVRANPVRTERAALTATRNGSLAAALVVPAGFSRDVIRRKDPSLTLIIGNDSSIGVPVARAIADGFVAQIHTNRLAVQLTTTGHGSIKYSSRLLEDVVGLRSPVVIQQRNAGTSALTPATYFAPSMLILALFFCGQISAQGLVAERRRRTLSRIILSGIPVWRVLLAKYLVTFTIAAATAFVLLGIFSVFGVSFGGLAVLALLVALTAAAMIGVSSLVTLVAKTEEQAAGASMVTVFVLAIMGGNFVPLSHLPPLLSTLSLLTPNGWALHAFAYLPVAPGNSFRAVTGPLMVLGAFTVATGLPALMISRRTVRSCGA